jgi:hypothetical protein
MAAFRLWNMASFRTARDGPQCLAIGADGADVMKSWTGRFNRMRYGHFCLAERSLVRLQIDS